MNIASIFMFSHIIFAQIQCFNSMHTSTNLLNFMHGITVVVSIPVLGGGIVHHGILIGYGRMVLDFVSITTKICNRRESNTQISGNFYKRYCLPLQYVGEGSVS